ncbi:glutamate--cysteine ligase [Thiohalobacter sp. IOR34]|uniref:glutamate--cysteine ligase n=1 Tax=Thiohalobacter sp. IOR34 TaxID=3057176 RepID=UPI0025B1E66A|nr:glutamate--cysteine ligase [Thiohalobacter sp. IOR34]WJW75790.1 glutamate--cysteine ligase [Thiohalobacter sp. IOR34]
MPNHDPNSWQAVPHLTTALTGPLQQIETLLLLEQPAIEAWFRSEWRRTPAPLYASVDLRNAGFKLAPVDTNLFPAGFNNLNPAFLPLCIQAMQTKMELVCESAAKVLLIPEDHTRNLFYLESLATLRDIIHNAGYEVRIGSLRPDLEQVECIDLPSGRQVLLEPIVRRGNRLGLADYEACVVILNNDLIGGLPQLLQGLDQPILPPPGLGWSSRLKSAHFTHYQAVAGEFSRLLGIDPWLINPLFRNCGELDFKKREGEACLVKNVADLLQDIQRKYDEYGIDKPPFVVIKADAGTYGMAIISVTSVDEVRSLNRKQRTKLGSMKGGGGVSKFLLQEGVYTFETWGENEAVAEPVVYMIDHFVVGGFYRVHTGRAAHENLNAPGMHFEPLAFADPCNNPDQNQSPDAEPNRFYAYGVIARLALLAAARELAEH